MCETAEYVFLNEQCRGTQTATTTKMPVANSLCDGKWKRERASKRNLGRRKKLRFSALRWDAMEGIKIKWNGKKTGWLDLKKIILCERTLIQYIFQMHSIEETCQEGNQFLSNNRHGNTQ